MRQCFIFAAGDFFGLREAPRTGDLILAADAGYRTCRALGLVPDLLIGDFDSMPPLADASVPVRRVPVEKDDTDTMLAIKEGLRAGCDTFHIYGGTGGARLDHTLANVQGLLYLRRRSARGYLYGSGGVWTVIERETLTIPDAPEWGLLSLFPMEGRAEGVTLSGTQYPLTDGTLTAEFPLGVSNHITAGRAEVTVRSGALLVFRELPD